MAAGSWDAQTYDRVSRVQEGWGRAVLQRRKWKGDEVVLDAGCGSGKPTRILAALVPRGRVYAVDMDPNMVRQAQANLHDCGNVHVVMQSDISAKNIKLPEKVDVVFSNAVLHWIADHGKRCLRPVFSVCQDRCYPGPPGAPAGGLPPSRQVP